MRKRLDDRPSVRIMLAEDHKLVRQGFVALLSEKRHIKVIGEASNGRELLDLLKVDQPDVILLDIEMPVMNGRQTLEIIKKKLPEIKVIILSMHVNPVTIREFMAIGAAGFLPKETEIEDLVFAIDTVVKDGVYYSRQTSNAMHQNLINELKSKNSFHTQALSAKEIAILKLICCGKTNTEIGNELRISANTVDFHRRNIYSKTLCQNLPELVKYAIKHEIISLA